MNIKRSVAVLLVLLFPVLLFACSGGDAGAIVSSSGRFIINTSGGDGGPGNGSGGTGGDVAIYMPYGSTGSIEVLGSGVADASFTPSASTPDLGTYPVYITADKTIPLDPGFPGDDPGSGEPYMVTGEFSLYISDGDGVPGNDVTATGLSVAAGATLTLNLNGVGVACVLTFSRDVDNHGTITTADANATQRGNLVLLILRSYHGNGTIDTSGTQDGQHGGDVEINPYDSFFNSGTIDTSGAESTTGDAGNGGHVYVSADNGIENTGNITADGGTSSAAGSRGGSAGDLQWQAYYGIQNSGNLASRGGDGTEGGSGGDISLEVGEAGNLRNSGHLDTSGGASSGAGISGGSGGSIDMYAYGGDIVNSGNLTTKGGNATHLSSHGGFGGSVYVSVYYGFLSGDVPAGDILFSGNIDTSGGLAVTDAGATGSGGSGGSFEINADYENYPLGQRVALLGYASIDTVGGNAKDGGDGAPVWLVCDLGYDDNSGDDTPGCNITNEAAINAAGGSAVAGATTPAYGGYGGDVEIYTADQSILLAPDSDIDKVANSGTIDTSSGDSLESDGFFVASAGSVYIGGYNGVTNSGNITARGGDDFGTDGGSTGFGSYGNDVQLYAEEGLLSNSGGLSTDGGYGEYAGGFAALIDLFGDEVSNSGALTANGGDADPSLQDSSGGDGSDVSLDSPGGMAGITQTGTVSNHGGTGEAPGLDGVYSLAGVPQ